MSIICHWRVRSGAAGIVPALILSHATISSLLAGVGLTLIGLLLRAWASGHLRKEKELATSGPYRYTRNPLYLGSLIIGASIVVGCRSWWILGIFALYFLIFYPVAILSEQGKMNELFPKKYSEYSQGVPLFLPLLKSKKPKTGNGFSWDLYKKNKEIRALWGALIFWGIITLKYIFL